jgi:hypothetical protein
MVQADMTAYRSPGEPLQLGLPDLWAISFIIDYRVSLTLYSELELPKSRN